MPEAIFQTGRQSPACAPGRCWQALLARHPAAFPCLGAAAVPPAHGPRFQTRPVSHAHRVTVFEELVAHVVADFQLADLVQIIAGRFPHAWIIVRRFVWQIRDVALREGTRRLKGESASERTVGRLHARGPPKHRAQPPDACCFAKAFEEVSQQPRHRRGIPCHPAESGEPWHGAETWIAAKHLIPTEAGKHHLHTAVSSKA